MVSRNSKDLSRRDLPLEALRGFAALVVVGWHFLLAFYPAILGNPAYGLRDTPFFTFVHGTAAVCVFFVLSGFVLTRRYFETRQKHVLVIGALKRWPRLFLPVFLSVMLSWLFFYFNLYNYGNAGQLSGSQWLATFGFVMVKDFDPSFWAALKNGISECFTHDGQAAFNPLLWTIQVELMGSYIAFAFAGMVGCLAGNKYLIAAAALLVCVSAFFVQAFLVPFIPGVLLAYYAPRIKNLTAPIAYGCLALGTVFLGYHDPAGFYAFLDFLAPINDEPIRALFCSVGATLVMIPFIGFEPLRRPLKGFVARALGRMSFPIYLVHLILIFSLGSTAFVDANTGNDPWTAFAVVVITLIPVILILGGLFAIIDVKWVAFVNAQFRKIKLPA